MSTTNIDVQVTALSAVARVKDRSALEQILDLGCEASRYRVLGGSYRELVLRARAVAKAAATDGVPMKSPLTKLFEDQLERFTNGPTLGWEYARAYKCAQGANVAGEFFTFSYENAFVTIRSTGIAGAEGEIEFNKDDAREIFRVAKTHRERSYFDWAHDIHPVGGAILLQRIDDTDNEKIGQLRLLASDLHPCRGSIYFGEPQQEIDQLAAFIKLKSQVLAVFSSTEPTPEQRAENALLAKEIGARTARNFIPETGYCSWCSSSVTVALAGVEEGDVVTGCPVCGHTWCD